ncbi:prepilin-type N-terminal cleavage/methylation domain-containing protein [Erwiniaceae bacterium BAC15a-03b]|uniref:Prepilin-type N-terminal cleavage/methylation domain-containing protein n=1 Tax=Winslowiella arboricola TaxID=2978220 RepID=A0A9J6PQQ8_9GAMM|nr:prepilin-type N-terminal cleavage/methylation domain-containing protein [Winslowiella arboricola]MCU5774654.1 prepilin-type N-terminal cleavage/methylation domain-containing protein [Winslowiella arboricola]MCU5777936.1 prepilin-type N-terminal cleavage/methylation domain-containing protein [Winslowiella arboricola]
MSSERQQGFSLAEVLFALLLFSLSLTVLMQYQRVLTQGFAQQWQQRQAWRYAAQRIEGQAVDGWQTQLLAQPGPGGCQLLSAQARGPLGREAQLTTLRCEP